MLILREINMEQDKKNNFSLLQFNIIKANIDIQLLYWGYPIDNGHESRQSRNRKCNAEGLITSYFSNDEASR